MAFITSLSVPINGGTGSVTGLLVNGLPSGVDNDQGNVRAGGTLPAGSPFTASTLGEEERYVLIASGVNNTGVIAPTTASTFNNQPGQVIVKYTTSIAGVDDLTNVIRAGSNTDEFSINQRAFIRTLDYKVSVVAGNWNVFSGAFDPALTTALAGAWNIIGGVEQAGTMIGDKTDKAANPTQERPGTLAYMAGNPIPTTGSYSARTLW